MSGVEPCLIVTVGPVTVHVNVHGGSGREREAAAKAVRRVSEQMAMLLGDVVEMALAEGPGRTQSEVIPPVAGLGGAQSEAVPPVADSSDVEAESMSQGPARHGWVTAERKAAARQAGIDLKQAWGTGGSAPTPPRPQRPLRAHVWVAVGGSAEHLGIYNKWAGGASAAAEAVPPCHVVGFPSLEEAHALLSGLEMQVADRRR